MSDYTLGDIIYQDFTTRAFATGIPTVLAGTPALKAFENDSSTLLTTGITLTVDHASIVGTNLIVIDTGASGAGFEAGKHYRVFISAGTVGGVSVVGEIVWEFSIEAGAAFKRIGAAGAGLTALPIWTSVSISVIEFK